MTSILDLFRRLTGGRDAAPAIRSASIYRRQDKYFVTASSQTRDGFWLEEGPVAVLDAANVAGLADAVRGALERSRIGIAAPKDWSTHVNRVVEAAGLKGFSAFAKGAALVSVEEGEGRLRLVPHRNGGSSEGYVGLEDHALASSARDPELAKRIETTFARCT